MEQLSAGNLLQRVRTAWLEALQGRQRILSAGEGHGRFASACAARFPDASLTCLESSAGMRARAQRRFGAHPVHWVTEPVLDWKPEGTYDAIVTCFFLDCFPQPMLDQVVAHLASAAAPDAVWLLADFAPPGRLRAGGAAGLRLGTAPLGLLAADAPLTCGQRWASVIWTQRKARPRSSLRPAPHHAPPALATALLPA
jgi:hypothetical protein